MFKRYLFGICSPSYESGPTGGSGGSGGKDEFSQDLADLESESEDGDSDSEGDDEGGEEEGESEEDGETEEEEQEGDEEGEEEDEDKPKRKRKASAEEGEEEGEEGEEEEEEPPTQATFKSLKKEYPKLFKDHPELRTAFFEHPKFREIFPDLPSAQEAASKASDYDVLERTLVGQGDPSVLVKTLDENNPKALKKIIENFGESLRTVNAEYYTALATPIVEELLYYATKHADKVGGNIGKNLSLAAKHMANYVFANGGEIPDISSRSRTKEKDEPSAVEKTLQEERALYARREQIRAGDEIEAALKPSMDTLYNNKLDGLTSFERKQVVKETRAEVDQILLNDKTFQQTMRALWKRAHESGYSDASKTRIRRAWLERAQAVAPKVRNRLRQEALAGRKKGTQPDVEQEERQVPGKKRQFTNQGGKNPTGRSSGFRDSRKIDWRKTSDLDILNS